MSNPNFVSDLVAMAKAFEELPTIKAELEQVTNERTEYQALVGRREESIARLKAELEASHEARRKVEAERDDAELRFLESEDRVSSALNFIKGTFGSAGSLIQALEPPAPVAVPQPPAEPEVIFEKPINLTVGQEDGMVKVGASEGNLAPSGQSAQGPTESVHSVDTSQATVPAGAPISASKPADATMGQGAADPTTAGNSEAATVHDAATSSSSVSGQQKTGDGVSVSPSLTSAPVDQTGTRTEQGASGSEDVGYFNEPSKYTDAWYEWCKRMTTAYPSGWPNRP